MFNRILVPLDGSPLAERAIPHAMHFARIFGGSIILLQVLDPTPYRENITSVEPLNWQIRKMETDLYLKGVAERIRAQGISAEHVLREGRPPENIVDFAQNENIELLVLTTHGAGGLTRWNISSVVTKVIEKVYMPVLIVRAYNLSDAEGDVKASAMETPPVETENKPGGENSNKVTPAERTTPVQPIEVPNPRTLAAAYIPITSTTATYSEDAAIHYQRVLLPIDSSRRAECSLPSGIGVVQGEEKLHEQVSHTNGAENPTETNSAAAANHTEPVSRLLLAAVIRPPELPIPAPYPEELQQLTGQLMRVSRESVNNYLGELQARIPVKTEKFIIENESIAAAIHEMVEKESVDLVILCAHGMTGGGGWGWPYGSVARNYIEYGTQTLLVIQDVPRAQIRQTPAEIAAEKYGSR